MLVSNISCFFLLMASSTSYGSVLLEEYKGGEGEGGDGRGNSLKKNGMSCFQM